MSQVKFFHTAEQWETPISKCSIAGDFLFTWGYGEELRIGHEKEDMRKVFEHLKELLAEHGLNFSDVAKTTVLLARMEHWKMYTEVYREYFKEPFPCRTTNPANSDKPFLEIDLVAYSKGLSDRVGKSL